jgi:hypothetical protein
LTRSDGGCRRVVIGVSLHPIKADEVIYYIDTIAAIPEYFPATRAAGSAFFRRERE